MTAVNRKVFTGLRKKLAKSRQIRELPKVTILLGSYARMKPPWVILHLQYIHTNFIYELIRADFSAEEYKF